MKENKFVFLLLLLSFFISCHKEPDPISFYIGELENYIPFNGGEQLYYFINDSERAILSATEKTSATYKMWGGMIVEELTIDLVDSTGFCIFHISIWAGSGAQLTFDHLFKDAGVQLEAYWYHSLSDTISNSNVLESFKVRDKTYYNVIEARCSRGVLYYCASDGVIKSEVNDPWINEGSDTIIFELEKIVWN